MSNWAKMAARWVDSIWHLRGSVSLAFDSSDEEVVAALERLLAGQNKVVSAVGADFVEFGESWGWSLGPSNRSLAMAVYERGRFEIHNNGREKFLRYDLRSLFTLVFCAVAACIAFVFGSADGGPARGTNFALIAFGWLYGMNMVLARLRIPSAIRKAVAVI